MLAAVDQTAALVASLLAFDVGWCVGLRPCMPLDHCLWRWVALVRGDRRCSPLGRSCSRPLMRSAQALGHVAGKRRGAVRAATRGSPVVLFLRRDPFVSQRGAAQRCDRFATLWCPPMLAATAATQAPGQSCQDVGSELAHHLTPLSAWGGACRDAMVAVDLFLRRDPLAPRRGPRG